MTDALSYELSFDGAPFVDIGNVTTYTDISAPLGTFMVDSPVASDGTRTDAVDLSSGNATLLPALERSYRVRVMTAAGTSDPSNADTGFRMTSGPIVLQWQVSSGDADADYSDLTGLMMSVESDPTAPESGEGRFYRVMLTAVGAGPQPSLADRGHRNLAAPLNVQAGDGLETDGVFVTWNAVPGAVGYEVHDGLQWNNAGSVTGWRDVNAPLGRALFGAMDATDGTWITRIVFRTPTPTIEQPLPRTYRVRAYGPSGAGLESGSDSGYRAMGPVTYQPEISAGDSPQGFAADPNYVTFVPEMYTPGELVAVRRYADRFPLVPAERYYRFAATAAGMATSYPVADRGYSRPETAAVSFSYTTRTGGQSGADSDECVYARVRSEILSFGPYNFEELRAYTDFDRAGINDLELNQVGTYPISNAVYNHEFGTPYCVRVEMFNCAGGATLDDWYATSITLNDGNGNSWAFPAGWYGDDNGPSSREVCVP